MRKFTMLILVGLLVGCVAEPQWYTGCEAQAGGDWGVRWYVDDSRPIIITESYITFYGARNKGSGAKHVLPAPVIIQGQAVTFSGACATPRFEKIE